MPCICISSPEPRAAPGSWDDKNLATGSVIRRGGRYWMAFTGHKVGEPLFVQRVGMAVSDDLLLSRADLALVYPSQRLAIYRYWVG